MPSTIMLAICLHVLASVFWAGSTMTLAIIPGVAAERMFFRQMVAAVVAILAGTYLWHTLHAGVFDTAEKFLAAGAICAILALVSQIAGLGPPILKRRKGMPAVDSPRMIVVHRIAAILLALAAILMAASRYA